MFPIHDENKSATTPYVNYGLLLVNIGVFFFFLVQGTSRFEEGIITYGVVPAFIINGEGMWTLITSMFMHADIIHLLGNMVYLWVFGDNIEDALGHGRYLVFYLLGGLVASFTHIASLYATLPSFGYSGFLVPAVGASGAISAVLGAYLSLYPRARIRTLVLYFFITVVSIPAFYYLGFWFLYQLLLGFVSLTGLPSGVAFWAHIGGFVFGAVVIKAFGAKPRFERIRQTRPRPITPLVASPLVRRPFVDVIADGDKVRILAELPGVDETDVKIEVSEREVLISAEHGEIRYFRRVTLPLNVVPQFHNFVFRNGVLSFFLNVKT